MIKLSLSLFAVTALLLSGCASPDSTTNPDTNRYDASARASEAKWQALEKYFEARKAEAQAPKSPTVAVVVTMDESGQPVYTFTADIAGAIRAAKHEEGAYGLQVDTKDIIPESATTQNIKAAGGVLNKVIRAPAVLGMGLSYFWLGAIDAVANKESVRGEYVTIDGSFNDNDVQVIGEGSAVGAAYDAGDVLGPEPMLPEGAEGDPETE